MHNPITYLETKYNKLHNEFKFWLSKQSLPVEAAVVTLTGAAQGALVGGFMGAFTKDSSSTLPAEPPPNDSVNPQTMVPIKKSQASKGGPLIVHARNHAVKTGVNAGISSVLKRLRGKEDVRSSMVAAFGSGVMFSIVSGVGGTNNVANVITTGVFFALFQGGLFKIGKKFLPPSGEDATCSGTRAMLSSLGLEKYEKNFKISSLSDNALPMLTDKALQDIGIPPEARLVILDHVHGTRDAGSKEMRKGSTGS